MATHYEVLGVRPEASHDEVKAAFTQCSLRWHPDRQGSSSDAEREQAAFRMREINAAWAVLRDPARRAAYDRSLAGEDSPTRVRPRGDEVDLAAGAVRLEPARGAAGSRAAGRSVPWGWVLAAVGTLLLGLMVLAQVSPGAREVDVRTRDAFAEGACVRFVGETAVAEVPCGADHDAVVESRIVFPQLCPRGTEAFILTGGRDQLCLERVR